jgi:predicted dithiol-disulfide oxidoreductase (DUF899 family)
VDDDDFAARKAAMTTAGTRTGGGWPLTTMSAFPGSDEYRRARTALLARNRAESSSDVSRSNARRAPGGEVTNEYHFDSADGPVTFADLFGDKDTLVVYSFMYGPDREQGCPMCTSTMSSWDGDVPHIEQRTAFAMVARSPIERIMDYACERGWRNLKLYSDPSGEYTRD